MSGREVTGRNARKSGPIAALALAVFTALSVGIAQSQIPVDATPWVQAVYEAAREVILPTPPVPRPPANLPTAARTTFTPGEDLRRLPTAPPSETPKFPEAVEAVPLTPFGPLPVRDRRAGGADAAQMCAAGCQESTDASLATGGGYLSAAAIGRAVAADPQCSVKLRAEYMSCMAGCGFSRLPEAPPGQRLTPADLRGTQSDTAS